MIKTFAREKLNPIFSELPQKYSGPKYDAHTHIWDIKEAENLQKYAEAFNIKKTLAIVDENVLPKVSNDFEDKFVFARFLRSREMLKGSPQSMVEMVDEYYSEGYKIIKFWFGPRWRDFVESEFQLDHKEFNLAHPFFDPMYERMEDLGLKFLIHNSDPDIWYTQKYQPTSKYGTKQNHLNDFETLLIKYPKLQFMGAHLGAQPEHLDNLGRWFDTYPNYMVDCSSARWMAREFSYNPVKVRDFFNKYSNRIMFGTDLSFGGNRSEDNEHYLLTRYLTYQVLFESNLSQIPLPFPDPENNNATVINGLDLSHDVLENIYWKNAKTFLG